MNINDSIILTKDGRELVCTSHVSIGDTYTNEHGNMFVVHCVEEKFDRWYCKVSPVGAHICKHYNNNKCEIRCGVGENITPTSAALAHAGLTGYTTCGYNPVEIISIFGARIGKFWCPNAEFPAGTGPGFE